MRCAVLAGLVAAGCGDGANPCAYVKTLVAYQNIWSVQIAIDESFVYYSDYDVDGLGTQLVWRQPHGGGIEQPLADHPRGMMLGHGMAVDEANVYWAAASEPTGSSLFATPKGGGRTAELAALSPCPPRGLAYSATKIYAGNASCEQDASRVFSVDRATGISTLEWVAGTNDGDVQALAIADALYVGTTIALFRVDELGPRVLVAGSIEYLELHGDTLYYSNEEGVFAHPLGGTTHERVHAFAPGARGTGPFTIDGDDLYVAEPPRLLHVSFATGAVTPIVEHVGDGIGPIVSRDGHAYWSALVVPDAMFDSLGSFSGGVFRVSRPCP